MITLLRVLASFAIVGVLLWAFVRASNGRLGALMTGTARGRLTDPIFVVGRHQLTKNTGIALVRAGERHLLVGVSDQGVQLLAEGDDLLTEDALAQERSSSVAVVRADDVVSHSRLDPRAALTNRNNNDLDLPSARTRFGRATGPKPPRMSFVAALREMTVRRS